LWYCIAITNTWINTCREEEYKTEDDLTCGTALPLLICELIRVVRRSTIQDDTTMMMTTIMMRWGYVNNGRWTIIQQ